jgi:hypothetical protein
VRVDFGTVTQTIEHDIIKALKEMIVALKRARQELEGQRMSSQFCNGGLDAVLEYTDCIQIETSINAGNSAMGEGTRKMDDIGRRLELSLRNLTASTRKNG